MKKSFLLSLLFSNIAFSPNAQVKKCATLESAISTFINYPEITKWLKRDSNIKSDSIVFFVDLGNIIKQPFMNTWIGCKINFVNDKLLIDSLKHFQPHFVLKNRPNYFVLISWNESPKATAIMLLHAFNNMSGEATIVHKGKFYLITKIKSGVL